MAYMQAFESYPKIALDGGQERNYSQGGGGKTTQQYRPDGYTKQQPLKLDDQVQRTAPTQQPVQQPVANQPKPPPPGVATQAPSPFTAAPPGSMITTRAQPGQPHPWGLQPTDQGGGSVMPPGQQNGQQPGRWDFGKPETQGQGPVPLGQTGSVVEQLLGAPSRFQQGAVTDTYRQLLDQLQTGVSEDAARRGLEFSSVPTDIYGREAGKIAGNLATEQARTYSQDLQNAIQMAMGFGQQGFQNQMAGRQLGLQELGALQGLGGYAMDPLGLATQTGMGYAGALGEQAGGLADIGGQLAGQLPFMGGGGGGMQGAMGGGYGIYPGMTPPFNPNDPYGASAMYPFR